MEEKTGFGTKNSSTLPSLANKYFDTLRDENNESIYKYTDPFVRDFVRKKIIKGGRRCAVLNQYHKSTTSDEEFIDISKELNSNGKISEILDKYFEYTNKHRKIIEDDYDSQFKDYRDFEEEKRTKYVNNKLSKLPIHEQLQQTNS